MSQKSSVTVLRERCLNAAIDLWTERGIQFTMSDLATRLSMSKKTLYVHFDSKEDLLASAVDYWFTQVKQAELDILEDDSLTTIEKVQRIIIVQPPARPSIARADFQSAAEKYPRVYRKVLDHLESGWEPTLALLQQAIDEGELRTLDLTLARSVIEGAFEHLLTRPEAARDWSRTLESMMDLLIWGMAPRNER